jgi:hypothetical protein
MDDLDKLVEEINSISSNQVTNLILFRKVTKRKKEIKEMFNKIIKNQAKTLRTISKMKSQ